MGVVRYLVLLAAAAAVLPGMSVTLAPSTASPAPLGSVVTFSASVADSNSAYLVYRFRTRRQPTTMSPRGPDPVRTVVDFGPKSALDWTTLDGEGPYQIEVTVFDRANGDTASQAILFEFSRLAGESAAVTPTGNPLIFIYSAPACPEGARMRAEFVSGDTPPTQTSYKDCDGQSSMNFYLAGMRAATAFRARFRTELMGEVFGGGEVAFTSGIVSRTIPAAAPLSTPVPGYSGILLQGILNANPIATDLNGNLVWYGPDGVSMLTRINADGTLLGIFEDGTKERSHQTFREFDLAGNTLAETNAERINDQLTMRGLRPITSFHHEAIRMPNGYFLVLAGSEQILEGVQGEESLDLLGDTILVLDQDLQVVWVWDSFDHMDVNREAILGETCAYPASLACSVFYGSATAHDWLHGNSLQLTPDGNILYSARHQDWVVKIDYSNGAGSGGVLWRLGRDADFTMTNGDDTLWFSHQHDAQILPDGSLMLFDNGNTRISRNGDQGASRGQIWRLDEEARTATLVYNTDLKVNSAALGTAQLLPNGNYHFDAGFIPNPANRAQRITQALETDPSGNIVWGMQISAQQYRNFRLDDLYTPPMQ